MKTIIYNALIGDSALTNLIPAERWFSPSNVVDQPERPFAVIRYTGTTTGVSQSPRGPQGLQLWIHDEPGSYNTIDAVIDRIKTTLDITDSNSVTPGETGRVACTRWEFDSGELEDSDRGTIKRYTQWRIVGR